MQTQLNDRERHLPPWRAMQAARPLSGLTVLAVEDSRFASEAMRLLCLRSGARIRRADCLRSAARHLQTYRPGVVIVDLGLPDGDGTSLIARIRSMGPMAPVVLGISGDPSLRQAALDAGADGFIAKPIESLAAFQQAVLAALPPDFLPPGPRALPDEAVVPGPEALRDDLEYVAGLVASASGPEAVDYIVRFLSGIARSSHDAALEQAADRLARRHAQRHETTGELLRLGALLRQRIASTASA